MKIILLQYKKIALALAVTMAIMFAQNSWAQTATVTFDYGPSTFTACVGDATYSSTSTSLTVPTTGIPASATINSISFTSRFGVLSGTTNITFTLNGTSIGILSGSNNTCITGNIPVVSIALFNKTGPNTLAITISGGTAPGVYNGVFTVSYTPCPIPPLPGGTNGSRCGTGSVIISATPGAGETIDWYAGPTGGTALAAGTTSFTTPSIPATTVYYAEARNLAGGCVSVSRRAVTATVNAIPLASVANQSDITCFATSDGTITVAASNGTGPYTFSVDGSAPSPTWLPETAAGLRLFTGLVANTPYRIKVKDNNGCISK